MSGQFTPYLKIGFLAFVITSSLLGSLSLVAQQPAPRVPSRPDIRTKDKYDGFIGGIREEMPLFPGCEERPNYATRKRCADSLMIAFVYDNLRYPYAAWQDSIQGFAVVSFAVEKDGSVADAKIVRDPGGGTGAEALRIVNLMIDQGIRWAPGTQAGKPVRVQFNLPVRFKMADHEFPSPPLPPPPPPPPLPKANEVIRAEDLERIPLFPGCEDLGTYKEQKQCADQKMVEFIYYNIHYPPLARENEVEGTAIISFIIEKDGRVGEPKIMENPGAGTGEEALRVFKLFNEKGLKFNPQSSSGRAVRVLVHFPVNFSLN